MKTKLLLQIVMLCSCALASVAQTVDVIDGTPSDSPVRVTGTVSFTSSGIAACSFRGYNKSGTPLLMHETKFELISADGSRYFGEIRTNHDHFFGDPMVGPHSEFELVSEVSECSHLGEGGDIIKYLATTKQPQVRATVLFTQLEDGTVWGVGGDIGQKREKERIEKTTMGRRRDAIAYLKELQSAHETGGNTALREAIAAPTLSAGAYEKQFQMRWILSANGVDAVVEKINYNLQWAEKHSATLLP